MLRRRVRGAIDAVLAWSGAANRDLRRSVQETSAFIGALRTACRSDASRECWWFGGWEIGVWTSIATCVAPTRAAMQARGRRRTGRGRGLVSGLGVAAQLGGVAGGRGVSDLAGGEARAQAVGGIDRGHVTGIRRHQRRPPRGLLQARDQGAAELGRHRSGCGRSR